ncbi:MAG: amidophosphoribosyltransferase [Elusimicrobia bacterium RIFCSPLOWO2_01_FULL_54_10]|nr:MAG: amidophosphoribosyltransferase [Elusimicrobia bacterium RIFCSPLOWO2_01_FULL_54_10]
MLEASLKEECGVCGVFGHRDAGHLVYLGLTSLQHRGQESAGIVSWNGRMNRHAGMGLVFDVFKKENLQTLRGHAAIGHVRYSTHGSSVIKNAQPLLVSTPYGQVAVGHNGNFTNAEILKKKLELGGAIYQTTTDTEIILHLIAKSKKNNLPEAILHSLKRVEGAYSLLFACDRDSHNKPGSMMIAVRDPYGFRPLVLGRLGSSWVVASETCAFDLIGAKTEREIEPGEMIIIENNRNYKSVRLAERPTRSSMCIFEFIYFARPDSKIFGKSVYEVRRELGRQLAREAPPPPNIHSVIAVPDSSVVAALGYAEQARLPFEIGFIRSHYVGRTFIEPSKPMRDFRARIKYNPIRESLKGKSVVLIDDSIVRGTTSRKLIRMLRDAGVNQIHMRISSPPIVGSCYYGIDTPTTSELIASSHSVKQIRDFIGVDSLSYLSIEGMLRAAKGSTNQYCVSCFSGKYLTKIYQEESGKQS